MISIGSGRLFVASAGLAVALVLVSLAGCGEAATEAAEGQPARANSKASTEKASKTTDRGNARFTTAGSSWESGYASARQNENRLRISASRMERAGDKMKRDELKLNIANFTGPGQYKADPMSMFIRVALDLPKDEGEQVDPQQTLMDALGNTSNIRLANADIEITSVSGGYIDGTFTIEKPAGTPESTITGGQFHARVRE